MKEFIDKPIEKLEEREVQAYAKMDGGVTYQAYRNAIEIVIELAEEYKLFGNSEQVKGGWIPCSERLPDTEHISGVSESVLVTTNTHSIFTAEYHRNGEWLDDVGDWSLDVLAWMPLPAPFKEGE